MLAISKNYVLLAAAMLLTGFGSVKGWEVSSASEPLVIQGRILGIQGDIATVKTPDGFPGGPGGHAQFVKAGAAFRVDLSHARVLLPDGRQADKKPLAADDRVLMVLKAPNGDVAAPASPRSFNQIYFASIVERIAQSDKMVTH